MNDEDMNWLIGILEEHREEPLTDQDKDQISRAITTGVWLCTVCRWNRQQPSEKKAYETIPTADLLRATIDRMREDCSPLATELVKLLAAEMRGFTVEAAHAAIDDIEAKLEWFTKAAAKITGKSKPKRGARPGNSAIPAPAIRHLAEKLSPFMGMTADANRRNWFFDFMGAFAKRAGITMGRDALAHAIENALATQEQKAQKREKRRVAKRGAPRRRHASL